MYWVKKVEEKGFRQTTNHHIYNKGWNVSKDLRSSIQGLCQKPWTIILKQPQIKERERVGTNSN